MSGRRLYEAQAVVAQLLTMFGELEAYWERGTIGPHMRMDPHPLAGSRGV